MKIKNIDFKEPWLSTIYMERYVNDGSPSGFTFKYTSSKEYSPRQGKNNFRIPIMFSDLIKSYSIVSTSHIDNKLLTGIPLHPDFFEIIKNKISEWEVLNFTNYPTASIRTLLSLDKKNKYYLKLHYAGILDRINRFLPYRKAIAEVELSYYFQKIIENDKLDSFGILRSILSNTYMSENENNQFSYILREYAPFPHKNIDIVLIPYFSLFSIDIYNKKDKRILYQLLEDKDSPLDCFLDKIIFPVLENYIYFVKNYGFLPEINAQNILLELSADNKIGRVIFRDLMGVEKDISIRKSLGLNVDFDSIDYKTISKDDKNYYKRHSFSYDFKLGKYIIEPLVNEFVISFKFDSNKINKIIKEKAIKCWGNYRFDHFQPYEYWYSHPQTLLVEKSKRIYLENIKPLYR